MSAAVDGVGLAPGAITACTFSSLDHQCSSQKDNLTAHTKARIVHRRICKHYSDALSGTDVFVPRIGKTSQGQAMVVMARNMRNIHQCHTDHPLPRSKGSMKSTGPHDRESVTFRTTYHPTAPNIILK